MFRCTASKWNLAVLRALHEASSSKVRDTRPPKKPPRTQNAPPREKLHDFPKQISTFTTDDDLALHIKTNFVRHVSSSWMGSYSKVRGMRTTLLSVYTQHRRLGIVGEKTITATMQFFSLLGMDDRCLRIYQDAARSGIPQTITMLRYLIASYAKSGLPRDVLHYHRKLRRGFPNELTASDSLPLFSCLVRMKQRQIAYKAGICLLQKIGPHEDIYTQLLKNSSSAEEAEIIVQELRGFKESVNLTTVHIAGAMQACKRYGDVEGALRFYNYGKRTMKGSSDVIYTILLNTLREASDVHSLKQLGNYVVETYPGYQPFLNLLQAFIANGEISNALMTFAAADSHSLATNLRILSHSILCQGLCMDHRAILRVFDSRPLGKYTIITLRALAESLCAAYIREHMSPCLAYIRVLMDILPKKISYELLSHSCLSLKGYGVRVLWKKLVRHLAASPTGFGGPNTSTHVFKNIGKAIAMRISGLLQRAGTRPHLVRDNVINLNELLLEINNYLTETYSPIHSLALSSPMLCVTGMLGKPEQLISWLRGIVESGKPVWTQELVPHFDVLQAVCRLAGETELVDWIIKQREEISAHRMYFSLLTGNCTDVLKAEYNYSNSPRFPSTPPLLSSAQCELLQKVEDAASVSEALALLPDKSGESVSDTEEQLPDRGLLYRKRLPTPQHRELSNDMVRWNDTLS
eukprot:TRINITY_DN85_c2_g1_i1.p1 TRINITY_DN85_c2_g1~~TRINITY_DN85_c2_g1_i1.p1  ORF type:complete len:693 (+),score=71.24 TRINITY_DN85_c2_g1_i1:254-2332(+)